MTGQINILAKEIQRCAIENETLIERIVCHGFVMQDLWKEGLSGCGTSNRQFYVSRVKEILYHFYNENYDRRVK